jgi:hypothetical protein
MHNEIFVTSLQVGSRDARGLVHAEAPVLFYFLFFLAQKWSERMHGTFTHRLLVLVNMYMYCEHVYIHVYIYIYAIHIYIYIYIYIHICVCVCVCIYSRLSRLIALVGDRE